MSSPALPFIECEQIHAGLAVSDIPTAVEFYIQKLGFQQAFTWGEPPTFAGVNLGNVQMFLAKGTPTPSPDTGAVYFLVGDADQLYEFHRANGVEISQACLDITYSTPARPSKLSGLMCRCVWRNVSRRCSKISPNTSA